MATTAAPLDDLAQRIERQQAELEKLRQEYQARQSQLADLTRHKEELQAQLRQVEADIQAVAQGGAQTPLAASAQPVATETRSAAPSPLADFLVRLLREAGRPMTVKQLADEVENRKFPTRSRKIRGLVQTKVLDLFKKGTLDRAEGHSGYVPAQTPHGRKAVPRHGAPSTGKSPSRKVPAAKTAPRPPADGREVQPPLHVVLTDILQKSKRTLASGDLARQARAAGYRSASGDFANVVRVMLGKMAHVEHVPGQGYRLKHRPG